VGLKGWFGGGRSKTPQQEYTVDDLIVLERYEEAAGRLRDKLKANSQDLHSHLKLAEVCTHLRQIDRAVEEYAFVADEYALDGFYDKGIALLLRASKLAPGDASLRQRIEDQQREKSLDHVRVLAIEGLRQAGGHGLLVAKIERAEAIKNLAAVVKASDGVMVARGDLGVEMGYAELAGLQKLIIQETRHQNKVVIMATQMMESMITATIPTRAEVSDVANAVMDGTDAVMLSAETASGRHPAKVVEAMAQIVVGAEKYEVEHVRARQRQSGFFAHTDEAIAAAVMYTANHLHVKAIVALTESGSTALWMSRVRSDIPIYAFTRHESTRRRVTLYRGVYPIAYDVEDRGEAVYFSIFRLLLGQKLVLENDHIILTKGELSGISGGTNSMQILRVTRK